ncbi:MAG: glycerol kinase GlpK [Bacteroidales bacterium]|nr:glycerol kinase GlpK [Bacteroidales bacterium]
MKYIISIDQSTSATKALLFDEQCKLLTRASVAHRQYYPKAGWVEHDAEEIYGNTIKAIGQLLEGRDLDPEKYTLAITNQRETVVAWDKQTGKPVYHALVWQDTRGAELCRSWRKVEGMEQLVEQRSGLKVDPNFCASKICWILDNVEGARAKAEAGELLVGTIDCWLVWKLTSGRTFATDYTNASRTMLFNIYQLAWDADLLKATGIPLAALPEPRPCDARYGETTVEGLFKVPIEIAGVLGDSHGALIGQMCFDAGTGKVTYGTGSSVMLNIGKEPHKAPEGLVTSIGFSILGKTYYAYEGNIYSTGATLMWMADQMKLIESPAETEAIANSVDSNGGVYLVPAFSGLGAPWWQDQVKAAIVGMTFNTTRAHIVRAAVESIAYQVTDLVKAMTGTTGITISELSADGGPTGNRFLMQFQADLLDADIVCTDVEDASALGAVVVNGFARRVWTRPDEVSRLKNIVKRITPAPTEVTSEVYSAWRRAVEHLIK